MTPLIPIFLLLCSLVFSAASTCSVSDFDISCPGDYCVEDHGSCSAQCYTMPPDVAGTRTPTYLWNFVYYPEDKTHEIYEVMTGNENLKLTLDCDSTCTLSAESPRGIRFPSAGTSFKSKAGIINSLNSGTGTAGNWSFEINFDYLDSAIDETAAAGVFAYGKSRTIDSSAGTPGCSLALVLHADNVNGANCGSRILGRASGGGSYINPYSSTEGSHTTWTSGFTSELMNYTLSTYLTPGGQMTQQPPQASQGRYFVDDGAINTLVGQFNPINNFWFKKNDTAVFEALGDDFFLFGGVEDQAFTYKNGTVIYHFAIFDNINPIENKSVMSTFNENRFLSRYNSTCGRCGSINCDPPVEPEPETDGGTTVDLEDTTTIVIISVALVGLAALSGGVVYFKVRKKEINVDLTPPVYKKFVFTGVPLTGARLPSSPSAADVGPLADLLLSKDLHLVQTITSISSASLDDVCKALIYFFESHEKTLHLLRTFIIRDVQCAQTQETLFRGNSAVTKMMSAYSRLVGLPWLFSMVGYTARKIILTSPADDDAETQVIEIDPNKVTDSDTASVNKYELLKDAQILFKDIKAHISDAPDQIRHLTYVLQNEATQRFPNAQYTSVSGFIFLRFINLAITSPEAFGLVDTEPPSAARRHLILLAKIMQNLANGVEFGAKERYMSSCNDFISSNLEALQQYCDSLSEGFKKARPSSEEIPTKVRNNSILVIYHHINNNMGKILQILKRSNETLHNRLVEVMDSIGGTNSGDVPS